MTFYVTRKIIDQTLDFLYLIYSINLVQFRWGEKDERLIHNQHCAEARMFDLFVAWRHNWGNVLDHNFGWIIISAHFIFSLFISFQVLMLLFIYQNFMSRLTIDIVFRWTKKWSLHWLQASCSGSWNNRLRTDPPGYRIARRLANWRPSQIQQWTTLPPNHQWTRMDIYNAYIFVMCMYGTVLELLLYKLLVSSLLWFLFFWKIWLWNQCMQ